MLPMDEEIAEGLQRLARWAVRITPKQMSMTALGTLSTLSAGPLRVSALAEREGTTQPGMTALVNRLAASGYVRRIADPTDGRATLVQLTEAGERALADRRATRASAMRDHLQALPPEHRQALAAALPAIDYLASGLDKPHD
jgi:DNA-binding MarR family transcriptional regulator